MSNHDIEIGKLEAIIGERSFTILACKQLAVKLGIAKGDALEYHLDGDRLIIQKVNK